VQEYWVTLPEDPTEQQLKLLRAGTVIEGVHVAPKLVKLRQSSSNSTAGDAGAAGGSAKPSDAVQGRQQDRRASSSSSSRAGSARQVSKKGRCVLQLDVSEGKKHEVGSDNCSTGIPTPTSTYAVSSLQYRQRYSASTCSGLYLLRTWQLSSQ